MQSFLESSLQLSILRTLQHLCHTLGLYTIYNSHHHFHDKHSYIHRRLVQTSQEMELTLYPAWIKILHLLLSFHDYVSWFLVVPELLWPNPPTKTVDNPIVPLVIWIVAPIQYLKSWHFFSMPFVLVEYIAKQRIDCKPLQILFSQLARRSMLQLPCIPRLSICKNSPLFHVVSPYLRRI